MEKIVGLAMNRIRLCVLMDDPGRVGLAVTRALRLAGCYRIHGVMPRKDGFDCIRRLLSSSSLDSLEFIGNMSPTEEFADEVVRIAAKQKADLVLPAGHVATLCLSKMKQQLPGCALRWIR